MGQERSRDIGHLPNVCLLVVRRLLFGVEHLVAGKEPPLLSGVARGGRGGGGGGGQLPPGADSRGAPKCLDVCYK